MTTFIEIKNNFFEVMSNNLYGNMTDDELKSAINFSIHFMDMRGNSTNIQQYNEYIYEKKRREEGKNN